MLTTEVENAAVAKFNGERDGVTKCVVTDHHCFVHVGTSGSAAAEASVPRSESALSDTVAYLCGFDEDDVVETADFTEHEVTGCCVLGYFDEFRDIAQATALVRVDEADVGLTEARNVT